MSANDALSQIFDQPLDLRNGDPSTIKPLLVLTWIPEWAKWISTNATYTAPAATGGVDEVAQGPERRTDMVLIKRLTLLYHAAMVANRHQPTSQIASMAWYLATGRYSQQRYFEITTVDIIAAQISKIAGTWGRTPAEAYTFTPTNGCPVTADQVTAALAEFDTHHSVGIEYQRTADSRKWG